MGACRGFSIIELLIYSALSIFLVILVLQFLTIFERFVIGRSGEALYLTSIHAGIDSIARDCASAPADPRLWTKEQPATIMWQCQSGVLGFAFEPDKLVRISRSRDKTGRLRAPARSTILNHVQGAFTIHRSQDLITMITVSFEAQYCNRIFSMNKQVCLHEGVVL